MNFVKIWALKILLQIPVDVFTDKQLYKFMFKPNETTMFLFIGYA